MNRHFDCVVNLIGVLLVVTALGGCAASHIYEKTANRTEAALVTVANLVSAVHGQLPPQMQQLTKPELTQVVQTLGIAASCLDADDVVCVAESIPRLVKQLVAWGKALAETGAGYKPLVLIEAAVHVLQTVGCDHAD